MAVQGLDATKLFLLMALGAAFAAAGIYLLLRPSARDGATRIELLGMKFNASSGGLLVFIIGALFLASPIVVPERLRPPAAQGPAAVAGAPLQMPLDGQRMEPIGIEAAESEANNSLASANRVALGSVIEGRLPKGDDDYFAVEVPQEVLGEIVASIVARDGVIDLTLFDDAGAPLQSSTAYATGGTTASTALSGRIDRPGYYVLLAGRDGNPCYQLALAVRAE
jgi:hypothetical protein